MIPSVHGSVKVFLSALLATQICLGSLACAQQSSEPTADAGQHAAAPNIRSVDIGEGITLHYVDAGKGIPVIFVHGSLSDGGYWADQVERFREHYRAIAYSRRYNYPNENPARAGYSAIVDAEDLAALIRALHLEKVAVVGHSYGALTALFLAIRHPEMVRALVLAEPPAMSLLARLPGEKSKVGKAMLDDIEEKMVAPMRRAFRGGDREGGVAVFIDYVFNNPHAWQQMNPAAREETMRDAHEWDVMLTQGELFPDLKPEAVQKIKAPILLLSGSKTFEFLKLIDEELGHLLPDSRRIVLPGATHHLFYEQPEKCRSVIFEFLQPK